MPHRIRKLTRGSESPMILQEREWKLPGTWLYEDYAMVVTPEMSVAPSKRAREQTHTDSSEREDVDEDLDGNVRLKNDILKHILIKNWLPLCIAKNITLAWIYEHMHMLSTGSWEQFSFIEFPANSLFEDKSRWRE